MARLALAISTITILLSMIVIYEITHNDDDRESPIEQDDAIHADVIYHAFHTNPDINSAYNEPTGYDGSGPSTLQLSYSGEEFRTEYNPQVWNRDTWFAPVDGEYLVHRTCVFIGWRYAGTDGKLLDGTYNPGERIVLRDGVWYADDVALADYGSTINVYATWAAVQQVAHDREEIREGDYLAIGDREYNITGKENVTVPNQKTTKTVAILTDEKGRKYVTTVHEKFPVLDDDSGQYVDFYGTRYDVTGSTVVIDHYPCQILEDKDGSRYIECYYYLLNEGEGTVNIRGETYGYTINAEPGGTLYAYVKIYGDEASLSKCPITTKKDAATGKTYTFLGYSRYYAVSGDIRTNIRLVDSLGGDELSDAIFNNCTIRGIGAGSYIDFGENEYNVGSEGCIIDSIALSADRKSGLIPGGNPLLVGSGITVAVSDFLMAEGGAYDQLALTSVFGGYSWSIEDYGGLSEVGIAIDADGNIRAGNVATGTASEDPYSVIMRTSDPKNPASGYAARVLVRVAPQLLFSDTPAEGTIEELEV